MPHNRKESYVKVWTSILNHPFHPLKEHRPFTKFEAMEYLLHKAWPFPESTFERGVEIKRGSFAATQRQLAQTFMWHLETVNRFIKLLKTPQHGESTPFLHVESVRYFSVYTIENYELYNPLSERKSVRKTVHKTEHKSVHYINNNNNINNIIDINDSTSDFQKVLNHFNVKSGLHLEDTSSKREQIQARLKRWSVEQIVEAIDNRYLSPWHMGKNEDKKVWAKDWDSLFRNDEKIEKALNMPKIQSQSNTQTDGNRQIVPALTKEQYENLHGQN